MGSVNMAMQALNLGGGEKRGPQGGNLANPAQHPERRNAPLQARVIGENVIGLHDSRGNDSAVAGLQKEQPWHRMAAHMLNRGFSNIEVADAADVSKEAVSVLRANRWFNELCATLAENKDATIRARLNGYALEAVEAIHDLATDVATDVDGKPIVSPRTKLTAFTTLLEHSQGKPTQKVLSVTASTTFSSEREEYDAIMRELQTTGAQLGNDAVFLGATPDESSPSSNA